MQTRWFLVILFLLFSVQFVVAQDDVIVVVDEAEQAMATPWQRQFSLRLGPSADVFLPEDSHELAGWPAGGELHFQFHPWPYLGTALLFGYEVAYAKSNDTLGYADYRRIASTHVAPVGLGISAEFWPSGRVNPFLSMQGGAAHVAIDVEPEDIESAVPLAHDELKGQATSWKGWYGGEVGLDVKINDWVGLFAAGRFRVLPESRWKTGIPGFEQTSRLRGPLIGGQVGLIIYYQVDA